MLSEGSCSFRCSPCRQPRANELFVSANCSLDRVVIQTLYCLVQVTIIAACVGVVVEVVSITMIPFGRRDSTASLIIFRHLSPVWVHCYRIGRFTARLPVTSIAGCVVVVEAAYITMMPFGRRASWFSMMFPKTQSGANPVTYSSCVRVVLFVLNYNGS